MVKQVYDGICTLYAQDTSHLVVSIENELHNAKPATNIRDAVSVINIMININNELKAIPKSLSPDELLEFNASVEIA